MSQYSRLRLVSHALRGHRHWPRVLRAADPKPSYDVVIIGGGGRGLATVYFLARQYGIRRVAVLERTAIGHGNSGRNTQVSHSDYFHLANSRFYERSLQLYEGLSRELNFNVMLSQRGKINLAHDSHELEILRRATDACRANGVDGEMLTTSELFRLIPALNRQSRFPVAGGSVQWRGATSRHDAVVWGFARAATQLGVDIVQGCEVLGFRRDGDAVVGVETNPGRICAPRVCLSVAGHSTELARKAGLDLPLASMSLQAMVSEPVKPMLDQIVISEHAGQDFGVVPYGTEALLLLRLEKGYLHVGLDTDGTTSPADVGWGEIALKKSSDYVGKRSLLRPDNLREDRLQLVGLQGDDELLIPGAHVRLVGTTEGSDGWVTSAAWSPTLGTRIALALVRGGRGRAGSAVTLLDFGRSGRAQVTGTMSYDPAGERLNG